MCTNLTSDVVLHACGLHSGNTCVCRAQQAKAAVSKTCEEKSKFAESVLQIAYVHSALAVTPESSVLILQRSDRLTLSPLACVCFGVVGASCSA